MGGPDGEVYDSIRGEDDRDDVVPVGRLPAKVCTSFNRAMASEAVQSTRKAKSSERRDLLRPGDGVDTRRATCYHALVWRICCR